MHGKHPLETLIAGLVALACVLPLRAEEQPLKVLYVTGGGWHDYPAQLEILTQGLKDRIHVLITAKLVDGGMKAPARHPAYEGKDWAKGYDLVIHNTCNSADSDDPEWVENIVQAHRDGGVPAVFVHCAMHCFRPDASREWQALLGVTSRNHEAHHPVTLTPLAPDHPVMKGFPARWTTPKGELYRILEMGPGAVPLARGVAGEKQDHVCVWTHTYGQARVFATTIGHHNETMSEPVYLDLIARGSLWAAGKLGGDGKPLQGYAAPGKRAF